MPEVCLLLISRRDLVDLSPVVSCPAELFGFRTYFSGLASDVRGKSSGMGAVSWEYGSAACRWSSADDRCCRRTAAESKSTCTARHGRLVGGPATR
jgi:hypothetical protein